MNNATNWTEVWFKSFEELGANLLGALPNILGAIVLLLVGWLLARFFSYVTKKVLRTAKFDNLKKLSLIHI